MTRSTTPARLTYDHGEFFVDVPGDFVLCAVSGEQIPLEELKYWDVDKQEAYKSPAMALEKMRQSGDVK